MGQSPQVPPQVGEVVNGYQWNGVQWVPLAPPPQVGQVANGYQWNGVQWVPLAPPPQVGQVANGYQWNGVQWVPLAPPPQVGQVANGHQWNGSQWVPVGPQVPADMPSPVPSQEAALVAEVRRYADAVGLTVQLSPHRLTLERVVAERKAFLATARLEYHATISLDDARRTARITELLKESGAGLTSGGGDDGDFGAPSGFGFQKTTYNTRTDGISESIQEQAATLGARYAPGFPYQDVKPMLARICAALGYTVT